VPLEGNLPKTLQIMAFFNDLGVIGRAKVCRAEIFSEPGNVFGMNCSFHDHDDSRRPFFPQSSLKSSKVSLRLA
jgi:hypothetical protein